ncbi:MAG: hypothetical protein K1060chlam2_00711 [Chlamydiae bacterium]|nr:hypothetical protein [Chlamydiota bacterium]
MFRKGIIYLMLAASSFLYGEEQPILYYPDECTIQITPAAGPRIRGAWNAFLSADFIYWTVREEGLFYAQSGRGVPNPKRGRLHELNWSCDPGFKVGLGFNLPHDGWDIYSEYTWFHSDASGSTHQTGATELTSTLTPYWAVDNHENQLTEARASWHMTFNNVTLELARNSYLSQYFKVRIHAGLQGAWIDEEYRARYTEIDATRDHLDLEQDYWGVGLRVGVDGAWQFIRTLSFFGELSGAALWGQYDLHRLHQQRVPGSLLMTTLNTEANPHTLQPVLGLVAGIRYEDWLNQERFHFLMEAGWEQQVWINHNQMIKNFADPNNLGSFILQGLIIKVRFDF